MSSFSSSQLPEKGDTLKPVIMNIHPGAYFHGTPETWYYGSPDYLMHHDVVYVCVAYRLHVLGDFFILTKFTTNREGGRGKS